MRVIRGGISKNIESREWGQYQQNGWRKIGCSEPQPSQEGLVIVDDYTISRQGNNHMPNLLTR